VLKVLTKVQKTYLISITRGVYIRSRIHTVICAWMLLVDGWKSSIGSFVVGTCHLRVEPLNRLVYVCVHVMAWY